MTNSQNVKKKLKMKNQMYNASYIFFINLLIASKFCIVCDDAILLLRLRKRIPSAYPHLPNQQMKPIAPKIIKFPILKTSWQNFELKLQWSYQHKEVGLYIMLCSGLLFVYWNFSKFSLVLTLLFVGASTTTGPTQPTPVAVVPPTSVVPPPPPPPPPLPPPQTLTATPNTQVLAFWYV